MSQRERWVIYPLLFFCFAMCIKLYWYPPRHDIEARSLICEQLLLKDKSDRLLLLAGGKNDGSGYLYIYAAPAANAVGAASLQAVRLGVSPNRHGVVETMSELGQSLVTVASDGEGGNVKLFDATGRPLLVTNVRGIAELKTEKRSDDPRTAPVRPPVPRAAAVGSDAT